MNKLFSAKQLKRWDAYTIMHEPITSIALMERAAIQCTQWLKEKWGNRKITFYIYSGNGNNGGDGLAIARLLLNDGYRVQVYILDVEKRTEENKTNLTELENANANCLHMFSNELKIAEDVIIIDAVFGAGLKKSVEGVEKEMIQWMNKCPNQKVSIDLPSGLTAEAQMPYSEVVHANYTLTFQTYKKVFLFPETGCFCGEVNVLDIQLDTSFETLEQSNDFILSKEYIQKLYKKRLPFSHKGTYGHALLICGSHGKMGACILAAKACLRSGAGLVTTYIPEAENDIVQIVVPEAMCETYSSKLDFISFDKYDAIGIGCGLGTDKISTLLLETLLETRIPLIIDADALNMISINKI